MRFISRWIEPSHTCMWGKILTNKQLIFLKRCQSVPGIEKDPSIPTAIYQVLSIKDMDGMIHHYLVSYDLYGKHP